MLEDGVIPDEIIWSRTRSLESVAQIFVRGGYGIEDRVLTIAVGHLLQRTF